MSLQWIEVDARALAANMEAFRALLADGVTLAPVVKSNGYGHGLEIAASAGPTQGVQPNPKASPIKYDPT